LWLTKLARLVKAVVAEEGGLEAAVVVVAALAEAVGEAAVVAVAVVEVEGIVTAAIAAAGAAGIAAGRYLQSFKCARKPESLEALRFFFLRCQGTHYCLCFPWENRRGNFPKDSADAALASLKRFDFPNVPSLKLLDNAFQIATAYGRTVCECLHVALALQTNSQFITADERLANSLAARFTVKWREQSRSSINKLQNQAVADLNDSTFSTWPAV
jgi:hypothetical protein